MSKKDLKQEIKEMESKKREESAPKLQESKVVNFDSWYHQRKDKIAKCHLKEILLADFQARGLSKSHTIEEFDKALEQYGVKLK